jgi:hypothetical protein
MLADQQAQLDKNGFILLHNETSEPTNKPNYAKMGFILLDN